MLHNVKLLCDSHGGFVRPFWMCYKRGLVHCSSESDQFPSVTFHSPDTIRREDAIAVIFLHQAIDTNIDVIDAFEFARVAL